MRCNQLETFMILEKHKGSVLFFVLSVLKEVTRTLLKWCAVTKFRAPSSQRYSCPCIVMHIIIVKSIEVTGRNYKTTSYLLYTVIVVKFRDNEPRCNARDITVIGL